ncbi:hypothetical protein ElyMa_005621300 [Elysia marginata]|uniref:Uncharacterized protein n=1 Tax=Elysia marginata TaxID=1093978 RepID=A0AAV4F7Y5_9GAST|nr:hypothetical protein ElyMa_005621300 [Elysia marginata]
MFNPRIVGTQKLRDETGVVFGFKGWDNHMTRCVTSATSPGAGVVACILLMSNQRGTNQIEDTNRMAEP